MKFPPLARPLIHPPTGLPTSTPAFRNFHSLFTHRSICQFPAYPHTCQSMSISCLLPVAESGNSSEICFDRKWNFILFNGQRFDVELFSEKP
jgi:hypothetical protein